ncbi:MAG: UvrD-helicase domain-containing protein [Burkholderiaceae bacterium]|jgi:ATP-dependent helicase/nuclease subunit A|nr:UvrD-helicase domain-containing protein [Burkholderiaceae bacterium]
MTPAYEHNGRPVDAARFYAIACDPRRSVAVEACAGAGKTWMLIARIVRALIEPGADGRQAAPHEILAITFTRKAAGEIRQRLSKELQNLALADDAELDAALIERGVPPERAPALREPLRHAYRALLEAGRPVQVRTFHGWFGALLAQAPLEVLRQLGLPPSYELLQDDAGALNQVRRPFLAALAQDEALASDYATLVASHGRSQTDKALHAALQKRAEFTLADAAGVVERSVPPFGELFAQLAAFESPFDVLFDHAPTATLLAEAGAVLQTGARTFAEKGAELLAALAQRNADDVFSALLTQKNEPRKFGKLGTHATVRAAHEALMPVLAAGEQHGAWQHQQRLARLTRCLLTVYAGLKRARGWVDMADLERAAQLLLTDPVLSGWVQQRLDAQVRHLLIDEFQDTSPVQWQALREWLSGYAGAGGGGAISVFIVGDPKQSIYRFRRAEPQVFRAAQDFVQQALGGERLACDHTRRCAPALIERVNTVMQAAQDEGRWAGFRPHTTASTDSGGALLALPPIPRPEAAGEQAAPPAWRDTLTAARVPAEETLRALEARQAAHWVRGQMAAGVPARDILVLARKNEPLAAMQEALRALGVPTEMPEKTALSEAPAVQDVIALADALVSPAHDLALARALKSPIFGASDAELTELALLARERPGVSWFGLLQQKELLSQVWQGRAADLMQYCQWLATLPPHDALQAIFHHAGLPARYAAAAPVHERERTLAHLNALLAATLDLQGGRYLTPYALVRAFRSHAAAALRIPQMETHAQAVRLLTVHGAKGLEAEVVLLLDAQGAAQRADTMNALINWPGQERTPRQFVFLTQESRPPPSARALMEEEQREREREELNALYVALTRAKRTLALSCITPAQPSAAPTWWDRLLPLAGQIATPPADARADKQNAASPPATLLELPALPASRMDVPPPAQDDENTESSRIGQAMHWLLEQVDERPFAFDGSFSPSPARGGEPGRGPAAAVEETTPAPEHSLSLTISPKETTEKDGGAAHLFEPKLAERPADAPPPWSAAQRAAAAHRFALDATQLAQAQHAARRILNGQAAWAWCADDVLDAFNEVELIHAGQRLRIDRLVRRRATAAEPESWWILDYKSAARPEQAPHLRAQLAAYRAAVQAVYPHAPIHAAFLSADGRLVES